MRNPPDLIENAIIMQTKEEKYAALPAPESNLEGESAEPPGPQRDFDIISKEFRRLEKKLD